MLNTFLNGFKPSSFKEWAYIVLIALLLVSLFAFYKAIMKCKQTIESYVEEQRNFKAYYNTASDFINYCSCFEKGSIEKYVEDNNLSEVEFFSSLKKYGDDNARIL